MCGFFCFFGDLESLISVSEMYYIIIVFLWINYPFVKKSTLLKRNIASERIELNRSLENNNMIDLRKYGHWP